MDRRGFFKRGFRKVAGGAIDAAVLRAEYKARHWIRPPFALPELDFLLACTRCDACIEACPHDVVFPLPLSRGAEVAATPALDIVNKGCQLCADWPCVNACSDNALVFPVVVFPVVKEAAGSESAAVEVETDMAPPKLALAEIDTSHCLPYLGPECGACEDSCPIPNTLVFASEKPVINAEQCVGCGLCREICIAEPKAITIRALPLSSGEPL